MAKKIITTFSKKATDSLRTRKIEHVFFEKKDDAGNVVESFVIVQNKDYNDARAVILADNNLIKKVKSTRHFQHSADSKDSFHYIPQFDCTCRNCGKTFKSVVKAQVWCSAACKKEFRNKKEDCVMNKVVKVTNCNAKLQFVKAIMNNTKKSLYESKCIADSLIMPKSSGGMKSVGTLLLNESSVTPEQWEAIVEQCNTTSVGLEWHYVEQGS